MLSRSLRRLIIPVLMMLGSPSLPRARSQSFVSCVRYGLRLRAVAAAGHNRAGNFNVLPSRVPNGFAWRTGCHRWKGFHLWKD
jgi:hypothetical protein